MRTGSALFLYAAVAALTCCGTRSAFSQPASSFRNCVDREVKAALKRKIDKYGQDAVYGYHNDINAEVFSICKQRTIDGSASSDDSAYVSAAVEAQAKAERYKQADKEVEEQRKKDALAAPRLKAEKAQENEVGAAYYVCLNRHASTLALVSNERAEVIAQASLSSCPAERQAVFDIYQRHNNYFSQGAMEAMESVFLPKLVLEVIKARALRAAPPASPPQPLPSPKQTPI